MRSKAKTQPNLKHFQIQRQKQITKSKTKYGGGNKRYNKRQQVVGETDPGNPPPVVTKLLFPLLHHRHHPTSKSLRLIVDTEHLSWIHFPLMRNKTFGISQDMKRISLHKVTKYFDLFDHQSNFHKLQIIIFLEKSFFVFVKFLEDICLHCVSSI